MMQVYSCKIPDEIIQYINDSKHLLTPDVSNYANQRLRAWIGLEAPLSDNREFQPAPFSYESCLWKWLERFCNESLDFYPEVALLHVGGADCSDPEKSPTDGNGGQCGIKTHRDAGYADFEAVGINLSGNATFGYRAVYPHLNKWSPISEQNKYAQIQCVEMTRGSCVKFNCKNPHFAQVGPNRWCINAWRISKKRREEFESLKRNSEL